MLSLSQYEFRRKTGMTRIPCPIVSPPTLVINKSAFVTQLSNQVYPRASKVTSNQDNNCII